MSRPQSEAKMGFYPAPPPAIDGILKHLSLSEEKRTGDTGFHIMDPCAGEGAALQQLANGIGLDESQCYAIELDAWRSLKIKERMPKANLLGRCSALCTSITPSSMSLVYVNPPFTDELGGGGRMENKFIEMATHCLTSQGVLVAVIPYSTLAGNHRLVEHLDSNYRDIGLWRFPDHCRHFSEIVVIGIKRSAALPDDKLRECLLHKMELNWRTFGNELAFPQIGEAQPAEFLAGGRSRGQEPVVRTYKIPTAYKPMRFLKSGYSDEELQEVLERSPVSKLLTFVEPPKPKRPPLPLAAGHLSMVIASGMLDGVLHVPGKPELDHVIRGQAIKVEEYNEESSGPAGEPDEGGNVKWKDCYIQRIVFSIRAVDRSGTIHTFKEEILEEKESFSFSERKVNAECPPGYDFALAEKLARITVDNGATQAEEDQAKARLKAMRDGVSYDPKSMSA